ncbi:nucleotide exchange factor GrpE [Candidatus Woesearchaeota archaeon]|nr:nucleotide exchange factor GrpE [Candidatus Woesearchaeota archaeon]
MAKQTKTTAGEQAGEPDNGHLQPEQDNLEQDKPEQDPLQTLESVKDLLLRTQANFENYRKQVQKRMEEMQEVAARDVLLGVLPLFDNLDLALNHFDPGHSADFLKGVTLISTQFTAFLEQQGVTVIPAVGEKFDPFLHEAILKTASDQPEWIVLEEYQRGFRLHGKIIRHAKVRISAGKKVEERAGENTPNVHPKKNHPENNQFENNYPENNQEKSTP